MSFITTPFLLESPWSPQFPTAVQSPVIVLPYFLYYNVMYHFFFHSPILSKIRQHRKEERTIESEIPNSESQLYCFLFDFVQFLIAFEFWISPLQMKKYFTEMWILNEVMSVKCLVQCLICRCSSINISLLFPCTEKIKEMQGIT